jgi:hypothetical protein
MQLQRAQDENNAYRMKSDTTNLQHQAGVLSTIYMFFIDEPWNLFIRSLNGSPPGFVKSRVSHVHLWL